MSAGLLRVLKGRIKSVENTKKITRAMEMVAASKLRKYQDMMSKGKSFAEGLENLLKRLSGGQVTHPFLETREEKRIALVVMTSDSGLCGSYNLDLINRADQFLQDYKEKNPMLADPLIVNIGKMGRTSLVALGYRSQKSFVDIRTSQVEETLQELKKYLEELYLSEKIDSIYVIYNHCLTVTNSIAVTQKLLPLEKPVQEEGANEEMASTRYIYEPDEKTLLQRLIPLFFEARTRQIFIESFVSEQLARMTAMHQATENASEMGEALVLQRNKIRQAIITKEIIEIVSGAQALKK